LAVPTTPIEQHGEIWLKRDDTFEVNGVRGGKVRSCLALASVTPSPLGLVTAGARHSPQVHIVAAIGAHLGIGVNVHVPDGESTPEIDAADKLGAHVFRHRPGYNSVIVARAAEDARNMGEGWRLIPFGMETPVAVSETASEVPPELPEGVRRIVVPVGSGMSLCGILSGLRYLGEPGNVLPVLGVVVGASPERRLDTYAPMWRFDEHLTLRPAGVPYGKLVHAEVGGIELDPVYEAKCARFLEPGDLLWVVGKRTA
jgi:1-aminocyclopropane-1-carboxylate deaminase/D-cysteine desulfhydrase-like pyridoxal-dependent ACC family enzyme